MWERGDVGESGKVRILLGFFPRGQVFVYCSKHPFNLEEFIQILIALFYQNLSSLFYYTHFNIQEKKLKREDQI
jgi:hypothetical protein